MNFFTCRGIYFLWHCFPNSCICQKRSISANSYPFCDVGFLCFVKETAPNKFSDQGSLRYHIRRIGEKVTQKFQQAFGLCIFWPLLRNVKEQRLYIGFEHGSFIEQSRVENYVRAVLIREDIFSSPRRTEGHMRMVASALYPRVLASRAIRRRSRASFVGIRL